MNIKRFKGWFSNKENSPKKNNGVITANNSLIDTLFSVDATLFAQGLSDEQMDRIIRDLTVSQADESRKSVTEKKELQIICKNDKHRLLLEEIATPEVISQILDTYMYGFNVFEVNWSLRGGLYLPELVQRDWRNFVYDKRGELKFKNQGLLEEIPPHKLIAATYRKRFNHPYGDGTLAKIYFPVKIKNASMEFWVRFLEKFGSPWAIGKTDSDAEGLANEINAMLSGDTAVIDMDEKIELVHPTASRGDFDRLIDYCDSQINRAILGGNLTGHVSSGSLAAAEVHNSIREDLANADKKILEYVLNRAIAYFRELNGINEEIYVTFNDEDDPRADLAVRDKTIFEMGYRPTKEYIETTYNITVEEVTREQNSEDVSANKHPLNPSLMAFKKPLEDEIERGALMRSEEEGEAMERALYAYIETLLKECSTLEEVEQQLLDRYGEANFSLLATALQNALALATLYGSYRAGNEKG